MVSINWKPLVQVEPQEGNQNPIFKWANANLAAEGFERGLLEPAIQQVLIKEAEPTEWNL
eukprot:740293-Pyramimonas_sp.AAC.1